MRAGSDTFNSPLGGAGAAQSPGERTRPSPPLRRQPRRRPETADASCDPVFAAAVCRPSRCTSPSMSRRVATPRAGRRSRCLRVTPQCGSKSWVSKIIKCRDCAVGLRRSDNPRSEKECA